MVENKPISLSLESILGDGTFISSSQVEGKGPEGNLPINEDMLRNEPSGNLFGLTQNAGMGWDPVEIGRPQFLILSTQGGLRAPDGAPIALGYHTGHWEIGLLVQKAAESIRKEGGLPFAAYVSDPCDGRTQGTTGMFDSLPYRNDAAITMRRLIRSLPQRQGVLGISSCDKGLPATLLALAGSGSLPGVIVPGGVTLPSIDGEDAGKIQTIGARFSQGLIDLEYAAAMGCRACGSPGGGCQFLGTAATAQVVTEALGLALPHSALSPSGEPVWLDMAHRSALALMRLAEAALSISKILTSGAIENAMLVHAAFGGSTNLLLHIPAIAHAAGLPMPSVADWRRVNKTVPRLVDALPNGPRNHPTVQVFMAGGVPEVMLHLKELGVLNLDEMTVSGQTLGENLAWWQESDRRKASRNHLRQTKGIDPDHVILEPSSAKKAGLTSTLVFPGGNLAPEGAVVKSTAIDAGVVDENNVFRQRGPARVFTTEKDAIQAIKARDNSAIKPGDIIVLIGGGPSGTGMEETYQITSALKHIPWGKQVALLTDSRFSGVSTGACVGHIGPEALAGGPIGKVRNGDVIEIIIDRQQLKGSIELVGVGEKILSSDEAKTLLISREMHSGLHPHPLLPDDTKLWAALQRASGGTWAGCVYDLDRILKVIDAGIVALETG